MSAGVSGVSGAGAAEWARVRGAAPSAPGFAPEKSPPEKSASVRAPQPAPAQPPAVLSLPEEQAFKVATINERLASTAARADGTGGALDLKA